MIGLWLICALVVAAITGWCALVKAFDKSIGFWLVIGSIVDAVLYLLMVGLYNN